MQDDFNENIERLFRDHFNTISDAVNNHND
jgi:hypothetical protein